MNKEELVKTLNSILERENPKYTSHTGAFLELLMDKAKKKEIHLVAELSCIYVQLVPEAKRFIASRIPGILVEHYLIIREDLDYGKFERWAINTTNWDKNIKESAFNSMKLVSEIESIIEKANNLRC